MDLVSKARTTGNTGKSSGKRGRIENLKPWKPGQSGNPSGRPKKAVMTEIYEEIFNDPIQREKIKRETARTMARKGMAGVLERREAADRLEGPVTQSMKIDVNMTLIEKIEKAEKRLKDAGRS